LSAAYALDQPDLFGAPEPTAPVVAGFDYWLDVLSPGDQAALVADLQALAFRPYEHRGYVAHRQVAAFDRPAATDPAGTADNGWPPFLERLISRLGDRLGLEAERFVQVLINAYAPGAGIGWHRDRPIYGEVLGVSLLAPCVMRLRRRQGEGFERRNAPLAPGSVYRLSGEARSAWEHSIVPLTAMRYSVTFRTLV
jgi:alkylated DNA repair dioxygenase AlkB